MMIERRFTSNYSLLGENNMTICHDCATNKGLFPKDKMVGMWQAECPYCRKQKAICDEIHDYKRPNQRSATLEDVITYRMMADMPLEDQ